MQPLCREDMTLTERMFMIGTAMVGDQSHTGKHSFGHLTLGWPHLEQQMGAKRWLRYLKSFGFLKAVNGPGLGTEASGCDWLQVSNRSSQYSLWSKY